MEIEIVAMANEGVMPRQRRWGISIEQCCGVVASTIVLLSLVASHGGSTVCAASASPSPPKITGEQRLRAAMKESLTRPVTLVLREDVLLTKPLSQFWGHLIIKGGCSRRRKCVIDGRGRYPIFRGLYSAPDCSLTFDNLVLQNAVGNAVATKCDLRATKCDFRNNKGGLGAAIDLSLGLARWDIVDCLFEGNVASSEGQYLGGGAIFIVSSGRGRVVRSIFRRNRASNGYGGAICINGRHADAYTFESVAFEGNSAKKGGGAVFFSEYYYEPMTRLLFLNTNFTKNSVSAGYGGAVALFGVADVRFCKGRLGGGGNRAPKGQGSDIAVLKDYRPAFLIQFCPSRTKTLSAYYPKDCPITLRNSCGVCSRPK